MDILEELDTLRLGPSEYKIVQKAYTEIERLREALKEIDKAIETWLPDHSPMRQALQNFTRSALQQKESK